MPGVIEFFLSATVCAAISLAVFSLASLLRARGQGTGPSLAYAVPLVMAGHSLILTLALALGAPGAALAGETAALAACLYLLRKHRQAAARLLGDCAAAYGAASKPVAWTILLVCAYLGLQAFLVPPANNDGLDYNLARILIMLRENSLFPEQFTGLRQRAFPLGFDILHLAHLRFYSDYGLAFYSFLSYLAVLAATYSLSLRITRDQALALLCVLYAASAKLLILQATSIKNDIPLAACGLTMLLAAWEMARIPGSWRRFEMSYLLMIAVFGLSVKTYFAVFVVLFPLLFFPYLRPRPAGPGEQTAPDLPGAGLSLAWALTLGITVLTGYFTLGNFAAFGAFFGTPGFTASHANPSGATGLLANALRHLIQAADIPGEAWREVVTGLHGALPGWLKSAGLRMDFAHEFRNPLIPNEDFSAFGFHFFCISGLALAASLIAAKGLVRLSSLAALGTALGLCAGMAWMPWNMRFFSLAAVLTLPGVAWLLHACRKIPLVLFGVAFAAALSIPAPLLLNANYAVVSPELFLDYGLFREFPRWLDKSLDRAAFYDSPNITKGAFVRFLQDTETPARVLFIGDENSHLFPYLLASRRLDWDIFSRYGAPPGTPPDAFDDCQSFDRLLTGYDLIAELAPHPCLEARKPYFRQDFYGTVAFHSKHLSGAAPPMTDLFVPGPPSSAFTADNVELFYGENAGLYRWMCGPTASISFSSKGDERLVLRLALDNVVPRQGLILAINGETAKTYTGLRAGAQVEAAFFFTSKPGINRVSFTFADWFNKPGGPVHDDPRPLAAVLTRFRIAPTINAAPGGLSEAGMSGRRPR